MNRCSSINQGILVAYAVASSEDREVPQEIYDAERKAADALTGSRSASAEVRETRGAQYEQWSAIVRQGLARFPKGGMTSFAIKKRLRALRELGLEIEPYSKMRDGELRAYYTGQVMPQIARQGRAYCPDVLDGVTARNGETKYLDGLIR